VCISISQTLGRNSVTKEESSWINSFFSSLGDLNFELMQKKMNSVNQTILSYRVVYITLNYKFVGTDFIY